MRVWSCALALFIISAVFYAPSLGFEFVNYDDWEYVIRNESIKDGLTSSGVRWAFTDYDYTANWIPTMWLSFMGDISVTRLIGRRGGWEHERLSPWNDKTLRRGPLAKVMHAHNVLVHAFNSMLLFLLTVMFGRRVMADGEGDGVLAELNAQELCLCALLVLLWAVHPLRAEAVCWVTERKGLLCTLFSLLAVMCYLSRFRLMMFSSVVFFAVALMAKPVAVGVPAILFAYDWIYRKRLSFWRMIPFAAAAAGVALTAMVSQQVAMPGREGQPYLSRLSLALKAPLTYFRQFAWPNDLAPIYPPETTIDWVMIVPGIAFVAALVWICLRWFRKRDAWSALATFAVAWSYVGLIPMIGIVKVGSEPHADRYTYWIGCGLTVVASAGLMRFLRKYGKKVEGIGLDVSRILYVLLAVVLVYGWFGFMRMGAWRDTYTLFADAWLKNHDIDAAFCLAEDLLERKRPRDAETLMREAVTYCSNPKVDARMALFLLRFGVSDTVEVRFLAKGALSADSTLAEAYEALGYADQRDGKFVDALHNFEAAIHFGSPRADDLEALLPGLRSKMSEAR